jgi:hypothetical protein
VFQEVTPYWSATQTIDKLGEKHDTPVHEWKDVLQRTLKKNSDNSIHRCVASPLNEPVHPQAKK